MSNKFSFVACFLCLCCLLADGQIPTSENADVILNRARTAYRQRDYETAKRELQLAQAARKDWPEASLLGALIAWQENKPSEAIKYAREAVQLKPVFPTAHYLLARLFFEASKLEEAHKSVTTAMQQGQQFADIYVLAGDIELMRHKAKEALAAYDKAISQPAPNNELTPRFHLRREAIRNMFEFFEHKNDPRYQSPVIDKNSREESKINAFGKIEVGGIVGENGQYTDIILLNADGGIRGKEPLIERVKQYRFTPALKDGKAVPFWMFFTYRTN